MKPNIIFILLDGSRFDKIKTSTEFAELLNKGTLVNNVTTSMPYTFGAMNTILTGQYGKENGVDGYYKVADHKSNVPLLSEILEQNGYFTARGLINNKILSTRGFQITEEFDEYEKDLNVEHPELIRNSFSKASGKPVFILLQFTRIHTVTVTKVLKKFEWDNQEFYDNKEENMKNYELVFKEAGNYSKKILDTLSELDVLDNSIVVFFSDHGTGIGERFGERNYGSFTYDETIRTYYHFIGKNIQKNNSSDSLISSIDILPTILDLSDIPSPTKLPGKSFAKFLKGEQSFLEEKDYTFSETGALHGPHPSPEKSNVFSIKTSTHKLIFLKDQNEWLLYDLQNDPKELNNLYGKEIPIENLLKEKLLEWINR
tara:strand:+ start:2585 stop:3700 length:1116 start_codon:yes stop_codon:yes gene_type:complete